MPKEENSRKRIKLETNNVKKVERCDLCKQFCDSVLYYGGHPNYSNDEYIALTNDKLNLYTGKEEFFDDDIPTHKLTYFSVYDKNSHLCPFDTGLVENNVPLYFSGYIKHVCDEDPNADNGVPAHDLGPIDEWWMTGYDVGEKLCIGFTTKFAQYYLMDPSNEYEPIFNRIREKTKITKLVVDFLLDHEYENPKYEDLIEFIEIRVEYKNVADILLQNAQFIFDQIVNIDKDIAEDEQPLYTLSCIRTLVQMAGISFKNNKKFKRVKVFKEKKSNKMSKAVTTKLVKDVFEHFFPEQIDSNGVLKTTKMKRCGVCENCQNYDCGKCKHCLDMKKFGGSGKSKQACQLRRCMYMAIQDAELSENEDETDLKVDENKQKVLNVSKKIIHDVTWKESSKVKYKGNQCYLSANIGNFSVRVGDYIMLKSQNEEEPFCIARIVYMYDKFPQKYLFHGYLLRRGIDTILGETADPRELFVVDRCEELFLESVVKKAKIEYRRILSNWFQLGGELHLQEHLEDNGETFFFTKRLESNNRFVDLDFDPEKDIDCCHSCRRNALENSLNIPTFIENCIKWRNEDYKIGTGVFLEPDVYHFKYINEIYHQKNENILDTVFYPEYYRKNSESLKGLIKDIPSPFVVGIIEDILENKRQGITIKVKIFFRPENTLGEVFTAHTKDLNYLYCSEEELTVSFEKVTGKCYLTYGYNVEDPREWSERGPFRFYFTEAYDPYTDCVVNLPTHAKNIGFIGKGKGGGKGKAKSKVPLTNVPPEWPTISEPLRCMDIFAGCGGLSEGLKQSKLIKSKWAIEKDVHAADAFRLNYPDCKVFNGDCNVLLKYIVENRAKEKGLPEKGDVEMLVGGPPCQGFSGMNRFNFRNYSAFKNSLVVTSLSYCEYYRPKYFILENVRNFVSFKKSMVLKLTLRCLTAMGYQVTFGIMQAGQYGVPQTRRRLVLMAAAPGYVLPTYPEPINVFSKKGLHLSFVVDGCSYPNGCDWTESAPYRTTTVRDAICDLPDIENGSMKSKISYDSEPITHFQRKLRGNDDSNVLCEHICKEMSLLVQARILHIPTDSGADWRDLPNISLKLSDGSITKLLQYPYRTKKQKSGDTPRGVCHCVINGVCDLNDKQVYTLIPWCLPHTGDRNNNWAGLYGRLEWDGYFGTTITNPEPMSKQGKVLHPENNRVVSVRECARSQGFPDKFQFCGNILDKYRQIGNAVPPPLGYAIGKQILKSLYESKKTKLM